MKVFISWSGDLSKEIGESIKDWLPAVLQNVKPYFTPNDIEKGSRWNADISKELEQSKLGIFIYTKENLDSQWMLFEAGAISKTIDSSKVCPILFGLDNSDFKGPLTQFQTSQFNKTDFKKLVRSINNSQIDHKLDDKVFDDVFEMWWPKLESKISKILEVNKVENVSLRNDRELLEEILALTRVTVRRTVTNNEPKLKQKYKTEFFEKLVADFIFGTEAIFDWDWEHTKTCLDSEYMQYYISPDGNFLNPKIDDEGNNWGNRPAFLNSYRKLKLFMDEYEIRKRNPFTSDDEDDLPF
jgi:hypothetical protein